MRSSHYQREISPKRKIIRFNDVHIENGVLQGDVLSPSLSIIDLGSISVDYQNKQIENFSSTRFQMQTMKHLSPASSKKHSASKKIT